MERGGKHLSSEVSSRVAVFEGRGVGDGSGGKLSVVRGSRGTRRKGRDGSCGIGWRS